MNESFEHNGLWWLPENPENQVSGQLVFTPSSGASLELLGFLGGPHDRGTDLNPSLIIGVSDAGKRITLHKCALTKESTSAAIAKQSFRVSTVFVGVHFGTIEEIRFKRLSVHYTYLDEWVNKPAFDLDHKLKERRVTVQYVQPEPVQIDVDGYEMTVGAFGPTISYDRVKEMRIAQRAWISLVSKGQEKQLDDFLDVLHHVRNFLTLAISEPTFPVAVEGRREISKQESDSEPEYYAPIGIFYYVPFIPAETKRVHPFDMLFTLPAVQDHLQLYISNWIRKAGLLKSTYDLYFSTLYNPQLYMEGKFLSLAQAVETYHRRRFGGKYQSDEEYLAGLYQTLVQVIPDETDTDFKMSLKQGKLRYANEFSLRKRLKDILKRLPGNLRTGFLASEESRRDFVNLVCDTRNFLTHYTPELREKSAHGQGLIKLTMRLKAVLTICLLEELGLSFNAISESLIEVGNSSSSWLGE